MLARFPPVGRLALAAALAAAACHRSERDAKGPARPPTPVVVGEVQRRDVPRELSAVGSVQAWITVSVRPLVTGAITSVDFREGDEVQAGRRLFQIDPRPYRAALAQAKASLARSREQARNARADARRYADLVKEEYVTRQQYDAALTNAAALDADVAAGAAAVRRAEIDLANCRIAAPISGRTGAVLVQIGNVVQANQANPLVVLTQMRPISVAFTVPEQNVDALREGVGRMKVLVSSEGQSPREGTLAFVNNAVDPAAGTILAKATFPNEDESLWPGEFVQVRAVLGVDEGAVVAPAAAIVSGQAGPYVYVVRRDDTVEQRPVKVARADARTAVIAGGLEPGERVVTDGQLSLVPGARVAPGQPQSGSGDEVAREGEPAQQATPAPAQGRQGAADDPAPAAPRVQARKP